jgi:MFS family permease
LQPPLYCRRRRWIPDQPQWYAQALSIFQEPHGLTFAQGNIIANQGFIDHVGFVTDSGEIHLKANYTALWGAMQSLGQLVGMVLMNPISDIIGRKMTMYALWIVLAAVSPSKICH